MKKFEHEWHPDTLKTFAHSISLNQFIHFEVISNETNTLAASRLIEIYFLLWVENVKTKKLKMLNLPKNDADDEKVPYLSALDSKYKRDGKKAKDSQCCFYI